MGDGITAVRQAYLHDRRVGRFVKFAALLSLFAFGFWSIDVLQIPIDRVLGMFGRVGNMVWQRLLPPDLVYATSASVIYAVLETIEMSLLGSFIGTLITLPLAWFAAWNLTPDRVFLYPMARLIIVVSRSLPSLMAAMLLVAVFGFGPFAGMLALVVGTIGFAGKLMAEQAETINMGPVDAVRATGAGKLKVFIYGIFPQLKPSWYGIVIYNWDARLRSSTILGFVGAGGIGLHLRERISVLEYHGAMGIIVIIIVLVVASEAMSHFLRKRYY